MSKLNLYIILCLFTASSLFLPACTGDFLDKQPDDMLTLDQLFRDRIETERYLRNVYSFLPNEASVWETFSGISDEADIIFSGVVGNQINSGNWSPTSVPYDNFGYLYRGIRSASVFMERADECAECEQYIPGSTTQWKAEARALRAWYYFLLLRKYGPVVLMKEMLPVDVNEASTQIPRSSYDECVEYIASELDIAMADLPVRIENAQEYGRVSRIAAMAMKSRLLTYAASPLWNGNADYANFMNSDGKLLVNQTYDENKWKKAADASKALIDMMPAGLFKKNNSSGTFDPFLSYRDLFFERWNQEIIWARPNSGWPGTNDFEKHCAPRQLNGWNGCGPTQSQVDAYYMSNGKQIHEEGSGYVEEGFSTENTAYTRAGDWNMYLNREPRFYVSILYNGDIWPYTQNGEIKVEMYATGRSGKNGSHDHSTTGYLITKFSSPNSDALNGRYVQQTCIFFRLAEIYLNYAEALNEYNPSNPEVAQYVNLIRERAGLPNLPSGLSQEQMRERIRLERRIELAFENHRSFDTRRWKIAEVTDNGPQWGMNTSAGNNFNDASFYTRTIFENRVFQRKHYLWPIPQFEMDRNKQMMQNPGW